MDFSNTSKIRELNDKFRATGQGGKTYITAGISALSELEQATIAYKVRHYSSFTEENDPHGEHDFGSFRSDGQKIFWKIDYYDKSMEAGSENPADPSQTTRVLTVLLASEY